MSKTTQTGGEVKPVTLAHRAARSPVAVAASDEKIDKSTRRIVAAHGGVNVGGDKPPATRASWPKGAEVTGKIAPFMASGTPSASYRAKQTTAMSDMTSAWTGFGINPEQDQYDMLDLMSAHIIDLLTSGAYTFAHLTKFERNLLFRYFSRTNPVLSRILGLHTDLPLSKVRLQAPPDLPGIAKDYIMQFFERMMERVNFGEFVRDLVLAHCIYGEAIGLVDDYFDQEKRVLQDITTLDEKSYTLTDADSTMIAEIERKYEQDPKSVGIAARMQYVNRKFGDFFTPKYQGPDRLRVIPFYEVQEQFENADIRFQAIRYTLSESLQALLRDRETNTPQFLARCGYSPGMLALLADNGGDAKSVLIDNDVYSGLPFIFTLRRSDGASMLLSVINEALEWEASKRAMRVKLETVGRVGRIVSAPGLSEEQVVALRADVDMMLQDPSYAIVTNFEVTWQEVNNQLQEELQRLIDSSQRITEILAMGTGMPASLISGDQQYSGSSIKLEILNVEYHNFKQRLQLLLEDYLFKPIALRKGFVTVDAWGNPRVCYPRLTFSRVSLRDESVFDILFSLYQKGSLPVSILLDILNLDPDDVKRQLEADLFTVNDSVFNEFLRGIYTSATDDVYHQVDFAGKLIDNLNLKRAASAMPGANADADPSDPFGGGDDDAPEGAGGGDGEDPTEPDPQAPKVEKPVKPDGNAAPRLGPPTTFDYGDGEDKPSQEAF